jgi:hypothetical protein
VQHIKKKKIKSVLLENFKKHGLSWAFRPHPVGGKLPATCLKEKQVKGFPGHRAGLLSATKNLPLNPPGTSPAGGRR